MATENLGLTELTPNQSEPHVPVNMSIRRLDALCQLRILDKDLNAPPGGTTAGRVYIVGPSPTGLWAGHAGHVAYYSGGWLFFIPTAGVLGYVVDEDTYYRFSAGSPPGWEVFAGGGGGGGGGGSLTVGNEDSPPILIPDVTTLLFVGATVVEETGGIARVTILPPTLTIGDTDSPPVEDSAPTELRFVGAIVTVPSPGVVQVEIPSVSVPVVSVAGKTGVVTLEAADLTDLGTANGAASLDGGGKVPLAQLPSTILGSVEYQGTWNANTNSPDLGASSPDKGDYFVVSTAGATSLGGITDWKIGDWAIYNGAVWEKVDNSEAVTSVAGRTGAVVLTTADLADYLSAMPVEFQVACSDLATALTTGDRKAVFRMPHAFVMTGVRASLAVTSSSGLPTVDVNKNGSTVLSTKITIDASELTSVTAATPPVISGGSTTFADDDEVSVDLDVAGTGAKGLIVTLIGHR